MFLATISKPKQLLYLSFIDRVSVEQLERGRDEVVALLADLEDGFRLLADLSRLDSMDISCATEIGKVMELCEQKKVSLVIRIVPDPAKDIGLKILSHFHYRLSPRTMTCSSLAEAEDAIQLGGTKSSDART
jgi:hypothetical protein